MAKKHVSVEQLKFGVYVNELDRPWTETQFMYQGFMVNSQAQLQALKKYCKKVVIDTDKGDDVAPLPPGGLFRGPTVLDEIRVTATYEEKVEVKRELPAARQAQEKTGLMLKDVFGSVQAGKALDAPRVREAVTNMTDSVVRNPDAMMLLSKMKNSGVNTLDRAMGVSIYMITFGRFLSLPREQIDLLGMLGLLQDVGKLRLPNLEDPLDRLTPARLPVGDPLEWPKMPLPQSTGWMNYDCFPRRAYVGFAIPGKLKSKSIAEVERGYYPDNLLDSNKTFADTQLVAQGASPGLQFPHFRGGETIVLDNLHPKQARFTVTLPMGVPRIWVDGRKGTLKETEPVIHTVVIEPDLDRVTILWRGSATALRPYLPAELAKMPFKVEWPS